MKQVIFPFLLLVSAGLMAQSKNPDTVPKELLTNDSLRQEQVEAGYAYMKDQTYEANAWRWWEVWEEASKFERKRVGLE